MLPDKYVNTKLPMVPATLTSPALPQGPEYVLSYPTQPLVCDKLPFIYRLNLFGLSNAIYDIVIDVLLT
jgi:hypothetical protein